MDALSAYEGYELETDPSGVNIPEVLLFRQKVDRSNLPEGVPVIEMLREAH